MASEALSLPVKWVATPYILLGNTYLSTNNYSKAAEVRKQMEQQGIQREYGESTVMINGVPHVFGPNDRTHPESNKIHAQIDRMEKQLIASGYKHDTSWVMQDAGDAHKKHLLCRHSEKLALAYALLKTPAGETVSHLFNRYFSH